MTKAKRSRDRLKWDRLLSSERLKKIPSPVTIQPPAWLIISRTETERDFDRVLYAAATRRLGDKTQVFPLARTDSVRNRLTHSHEVANLARSLGIHLVNSPLAERMLQDTSRGSITLDELKRAVPAMLAAAGLAHDIGNPPFGHQGEETIRSWVRRRSPELFTADGAAASRAYDPPTYTSDMARDLLGFSPAQQEDFLKFEGNAQMLRTLGRLQVVKDDRGLNLTFGTLATLMKYTVSSSQADSTSGAPVMTRKPGFFASDAAFAEQIRSACGLDNAVRHPLTFIMEACDDIAYLVTDAEDAIKKRVVSFHDLMSWLRDWKEDGKEATDPLVKWLTDKGEDEAKNARRLKVPPSEVNDVAMQIFRADAITAMVSAVIEAFSIHYSDIMDGTLSQPLLEVGPAAALAHALKAFDRQHAYMNRGVLEIELHGYNIISDLMDMLWRGITERESYADLGSMRRSPFAQYAYSRISENYRRVFEGRFAERARNDLELSIRYRELQLLTDMISGMTDRFACDLHRELREYHVGASQTH